mgnify:CR=1 FL=1
MKKKLCIILLLFLMVASVALVLPQEKEYDYLRLHIRANSNMTTDQNVKYAIKDILVEFLSPYFCNVSSKGQAIELVNSLSANIKQKCESVLRSEGFNYSANVKIAKEYFPTRTYSNTTLKSGYYDAVVVELGQAVGDNWWCVMYPPLCFVNKNENITHINYKSKIVEWFNSIFKK